MTGAGGGPLDFDPLEELFSLQPGDLLGIWMETDYLVTASLRCKETIDGDTTEWRWLFLDNGDLLEASPDGYFRYRSHQVVRQGTELYEELVAQDGALVRFEQRVRESASGRRPVHVTLDGKEYRVASTGTVDVDLAGEAPDLLPYKSLSRDASRNVYFGLLGVEDEADVVLGLWTAHVCLSFGRPLEASQISGVHRQQRGGRNGPRS